MSNKTKVVDVGGVKIGGDNRPHVQSMTNTDTVDVESTVEQIRRLEKYDCDLVRASVPDEDSAHALSEIRNRINIPLVGDIHFNHELALMAAPNVDKLRINPGNIGGKEKVKEVVEKAKEYDIAMRVGVNSGSIEKEFKDRPTAEGMYKSVIKYVNMLEDLGFGKFVWSAKSSNVDETVSANRKIANDINYPAHLGVTEAGGGRQGIIKNTAGMSRLLGEYGIGDTIRVSLSEDPKEEVITGKQILAANGLYDMPEVISCPTCARTRMDVIYLSDKLQEEFVKNTDDYIDSFNKVALMGCNVNGPGEAEKTDIGFVGNSKNDNILIYRDGEIERPLKTDDRDEVWLEIKKELERYKK